VERPTVGHPLVVLAVCGALVGRGAGGWVGSAPSAPATTTAVTAVTAAPVTTTTPVASSTTSTTTVTTTVAPLETLAPIVTHDARVDVLAPLPVVAPVGVRIDGVGIDGRVEPTGVDGRGELAVPDDAKTLVWYRHGPSPGDAGSAVIAGHLDWKGALGTLNALAETPVGASVIIDYADGSTRSFVVRSVELVDKPAVAVNGIFAGDGERLVRLVTCGGEYNDAINRYHQNVVVTAVPA
jgi:Sortase domain